MAESLQVHFRHEPTSPIRFGAFGWASKAHRNPVALKGRAGSTRQSYQIVRLETDMIAPLPEIPPSSDRTRSIRSGAFRERNVDMWLRAARKLFRLEGAAFYRRHSFSNYLLFAVDEKQRISRRSLLKRRLKIPLRVMRLRRLTERIMAMNSFELDSPGIFCKSGLVEFARLPRRNVRRDFVVL